MLWSMTKEEEVIELRAEIAGLKEQVRQLLAANAQLRRGLDKYKSEPPPFVKPNGPNTPSPKIKLKRSPDASEPKTTMVVAVGNRHLPKQYSTKWSSAPPVLTLCNTPSWRCAVR